VIRVAVNRQDLRRYDIEAWLHVMFYKISSVFSIAEAIAAIAYLLLPSPTTKTLFGVLTLVFWALLTPSFYELSKGFLMIYSRGAAYSHIAENIRERLLKRYSVRARVSTAALYILIIVWILAPIALILGWFYGWG